MICKECIHYEVCEYKELPVIAEQCVDFKDKSKYIELPCRVGDKVYVIHNIITTTPFIKEETVLYIEYCLGDAVKTWRIKTEYGSYDYKDLFLNKKEAEQKLKDLLKNGKFTESRKPRNPRNLKLRS